MDTVGKWGQGGNTGKDVIALYDSLVEQRSDSDKWFYTLKDFVLPFAPGQLERSVTADGVTYNNIFDTTAIDCNSKLAAAQSSNITPNFKQWLRYEPALPDGEVDANVYAAIRKWYARCSEIAFKLIGESNFYSEAFSMYLDRGAFGTGGLYCGMSDKQELFFEALPFGNFVGADGPNGLANLVIRTVSYTAAQAVAFFGAQAVSDKIREAYGDFKRRDKDRFLILHLVREREKRTWGRTEPKHKPWESIYVERESGHVIEESGFNEFPFCITRFLRWSGAGRFYGIPAGRLCYPDIIACQRIKRIKSVLAELKAFPRILEGADYEGQIDFRPGGRTIVDSSNPDLPREWATSGESIYSEKELMEHQHAIKEAYLVNAIQMFLEEDKQMTATEVNHRYDEKLMAFTPSFSLFIAEFLPIMHRVFCLLYRAGRFPAVPEGVTQVLGGIGEELLLKPTVTYQSKYATKLRELQAGGMVQTMGMLEKLMQFGPNGLATLDNFDLDYLATEYARGMDAPEAFIRNKTDVEQDRKQRAEAQAMAAQMQIMQEAAANGQPMSQGGQQPGADGYGVEI